MTSVYQRFTNEQWHEMINELLEREAINETEAEIFRWAVFDRTHHWNSLHTDEERKEAKRKCVKQH